MHRTQVCWSVFCIVLYCIVLYGTRFPICLPSTFLYIYHAVYTWYSCHCMYAYNSCAYHCIRTRKLCQGLLVILAKCSAISIHYRQLSCWLLYCASAWEKLPSKDATYVFFQWGCWYGRRRCAVCTRRICNSCMSLCLIGHIPSAAEVFHLMPVGIQIAPLAW